jgi:hypothetical protein
MCVESLARPVAKALHSLPVYYPVDFFHYPRRARIAQPPPAGNRYVAAMQPAFAAAMQRNACSAEV